MPSLFQVYLASDITPTQYAELQRKRTNVVTFVGGASRMVGGYTSRDGYWLDAVWWLLWLEKRNANRYLECLG